MTERREEPGPLEEGRSDAERAFFSGEGAAEAEGAGPPPPRRRSPLLARSPAFSTLALAACAWLLWDLWPEVAYFASPAEPIDLGALGAYHLERARPNRLARIGGAPAAQVGATEARGEARRVLGLFGTNLVVDRPGAGGAANVFEGRLLPRARALDYAPVVAALKERGFAAGDAWEVLRDGERPRQRWGPPLLALVVAAVAALNLRALARRLLR